MALWKQSIMATNLRFSHPELPNGGWKAWPEQTGNDRGNKAEGGDMNITIEYVILVVIESILVASILGLLFYYLRT